MGKARNLARLVVDGGGTIGSENLTNAPNPIVAGTIAYLGMSSAPTGWLKANGAAVSRTTYASLFSAIGTTYGTGDGSTTFNVPDLRGEFLRGFDDGRGVDSGRGIGTTQSHQMQSHNHLTTDRERRNGYGYGAGALVERSPSDSYQGQLSSLFSSQGGTTNSSENRPRNVALLACIKF